MKQLTLFDMDDYRLKCPYCGSSLICVDQYEGHRDIFCGVCAETLKEEYVSDQQDTNY